MIHPARDAVILQPAKRGAAGEALIRRSDRRHLLLAVAAAILFHLLIVLGFWLADILRIRDIGEWSGPVLVKIGSPDAVESPLPDLAPLVEETEIPLEEPPSETVPETQPSETTPSQPDSPDAGDRPVAQTQPQQSPKPNTPAEPAGSSQPAVSQARPAPAPVPSRVRGQEEGNNYEMNFDGTEGEVGRAAAYEYITSYMPLPEVLPAALMERIVGTESMPPDFIRGEIEKYWESVFDEYSKKPGRAGIVPLPDRPYYWSLLTNYLKYDIADADWKSAGMRPVVVEFTVGLSQGAMGASLSDFKLVTRTNDPRVDEAVIYGLSRWVYYNKADRPIKGRITYNFDK